MAESSRGRSLFGRLLTGFGLVWLFWSLFGDLVTLELGTSPISLPLLPGFVFLFIGRALGRGARRRVPEPQEAESPRPQPTRAPDPRPVESLPSLPKSRTRDVIPVVEEEPIAVAEVITESVASDMEQMIEQAGTRKSSAEMVAEARERFGRRTS